MKQEPSLLKLESHGFFLSKYKMVKVIYDNQEGNIGDFLIETFPEYEFESKEVLDLQNNRTSRAKTFKNKRKVTNTGSVSIPMNIRIDLGIKEGDYVDFVKNDYGQYVFIKYDESDPKADAVTSIKIPIKITNKTKFKTVIKGDAKAKERKRQATLRQDRIDNGSATLSWTEKIRACRINLSC